MSSSSRQHLFKDTLTSDLALLIGSFLELPDLNNLARSDQYLLELFFNLNIEKVEYIVKRKAELKEEDIESKIVSIKDKFREDESLSVQTIIWKPLVLYYFPNYSKSLNIKNWMHVLRRRVVHLQIHYPNLLPLLSSKKASSIYYRPNVGKEFIENCEWEYECPLKDHAFTLTEPNVRYCKVCQENVYEVFTADEFKVHVDQDHCVQFSKYLSKDVRPKRGKVKRR